MKLGAINKLLDGELIGSEDIEIIGVASIEDSAEGDLVFAENSSYLDAALKSRAGAILAPSTEKHRTAGSYKSIIFTDRPRNAFVTVLEAFSVPTSAPEGLHPSAVLGSNIQMGVNVRIGAHVSVGDNTILGDRVILLPGVRVAENCSLGEDTILFPNVVLYPGVTVGKRCRVHGGCVVGADGFGYVPVGSALRKVPQLGVVSIGDDVEIGANSCIDRAKTGITTIGAGTKIDNLVQIGHNVQIGQSCVIVAMTGIGGSSRLGNGVVLGGQSGVVDNLTIGDGARLSAQACAISDVAPGETIIGFPGRPSRERMREYAATASLPDQIKRIRAMEKRISELESRLKPDEVSTAD